MAYCVYRTKHVNKLSARAVAPYRDKSGGVD